MQVVVSISLQTSNSALHAGAGDGAGMAGDSSDLQESPGSWSAPYAFSSFTRKPLNSGVNALGSMTVGVSRLATVRAFLPSSSAMPRKP